MYTNTMEYCSALKMKEILTHATTRMTLENKVSEISQSQKDKFHLCKIPRTVKLIETGNRMVTARGWKKEECGITV